jgi:hypothetical protein
MAQVRHSSNGCGPERLRLRGVQREEISTLEDPWFVRYLPMDIAQHGKALRVVLSLHNSGHAGVT